MQKAINLVIHHHRNIIIRDYHQQTLSMYQMMMAGLKEKIIQRNDRHAKLILTCDTEYVNMGRWKFSSMKVLKLASENRKEFVDLSLMNRHA